MLRVILVILIGIISNMVLTVELKLDDRPMIHAGICVVLATVLAVAVWYLLGLPW